jgi:hypothetical protein
LWLAATMVRIGRVCPRAGWHPCNVSGDETVRCFKCQMSLPAFEGCTWLYLLRPRIHGRNMVACMRLMCLVSVHLPLCGYTCLREHGDRYTSGVLSACMEACTWHAGLATVLRADPTCVWLVHRLDVPYGLVHCPVQRSKIAGSPIRSEICRDAVRGGWGCGRTPPKSVRSLLLPSCVHSTWLASDYFASGPRPFAFPR